MSWWGEQACQVSTSVSVCKCLGRDCIPLSVFLPLSSFSTFLFHISILFFFQLSFFPLSPFSPNQSSISLCFPITSCHNFHLRLSLFCVSFVSLPRLCPSLFCIYSMSLPLLYLSPFRRHTGAIGCIPRFRFRNSNEWTLTAFPSPPSLRLILCKYFVAQLHNKREALPLAKNTNLITSFTIYKTTRTRFKNNTRVRNCRDRDVIGMVMGVFMVIVMVSVMGRSLGQSWGSTLLHYISFEIWVVWMINTNTQRTIQRSSSWAINYSWGWSWVGCGDGH